MDKISNLPKDITNEILSKLPLRDSVRTSVLSRKWRYKWNTLPHLVFDEQLVSSQGQTLVKYTLKNIVDHVLLLHAGPIYSFKLSRKDILDFSDIDRWILYLSRSSFKELTIDVRKGQRYNIPSYLYSCLGLIHLELYNCLVRPPPSTFNGLSCLTSLHLEDSSMTQDAIENLISGCLLLERLVFKNFIGFTRLKIRAPKLIYFKSEGNFFEVTFENTKNLSEVVISFMDFHQNLAHNNFFNLVKFFTEVPHIQRLQLLAFCLKVKRLYRLCLMHSELIHWIIMNVQMDSSVLRNI